MVKGRPGYPDGLLAPCRRPLRICGHVPAVERGQVAQGDKAVRLYHVVQEVHHIVAKGVAAYGIERVVVEPHDAAGWRKARRAEDVDVMAVAGQPRAYLLGLETVAR